MPPRLFIGQSANQQIDGIIRLHTGPCRALAPDERPLGAYILPPFQRPPVWTEAQKIRLIESLYMGMPIGALVVNLTRSGQPCDGWLLDGQQRLSTILDYVGSRFKVNGLLWSDLTDLEQRLLRRITVAVITTNIADPAICRDVYDRLVYGGTVHSATPA